MPVFSPYQTYQLYKVSQRNTSISIMKGDLAVAPKDQISVGGPQIRFSIASGLRKIVAPIICSSTTESICVLSPQSANLTSLKRLPLSLQLTSMLSGFTSAIRSQVISGDML